MSFVVVRIRALFQDPFFRRSSGFFVGSMVVAVLNYAYHPVVGRLLSLRDFGDVQAAFSLATQLTTVIGAFTLATVHASVNADEHGNERALVRFLRRVALVLVACCSVGLLCASSFLAAHFQFASKMVLFALAAFLISTVLYSVRLGFLQGKGQFFRVSLANIMVAGGRLLFAALFVWMGWRAFGAMAGFVTAQLVALGWVVYWTRDHLRAPVEAFPSLPHSAMARELGFVGAIMITTFYITLLYTGDVLLVKQWFSPDLAGAYSGIATVAKISIFATGPFSAVLVSSVQRRGDKRVARGVVLKAVGLITVVGGGAALFFALFPTFATQLLIGTRYLAWAHLLPWLAGAFFLVSLANVACNVGLAWRSWGLLPVIAAGSVGVTLLLVGRHDSLEAVAQAFFGGALCAAVTGGIFLWRHLRT